MLTSPLNLPEFTVSSATKPQKDENTDGGCSQWRDPAISPTMKLGQEAPLMHTAFHHILRAVSEYKGISNSHTSEKNSHYGLTHPTPILPSQFCFPKLDLQVGFWRKITYSNPSVSDMKEVLFLFFDSSGLPTKSWHLQIEIALPLLS